MARRTVVTTTSDLSGQPADETLRFALDHQAYEIDLTREEAEAFRALVVPFLTGARRVTSSGRVINRTLVGASQTTIRAWARSAGVHVPARGMVPRAVREQFQAAQMASSRSSDAAPMSDRLSRV